MEGASSVLLGLLSVFMAGAALILFHFQGKE